jgi:arsenate reductase
LKRTVLFICTHNSARSQLAEGLVNQFFQNEWEAYSAGTTMTFVKPLAVRAMAEIGVDITHHRSKSLTTFKDKTFDLVVTVCDSAKESCPYLQGKRVIHAGFKDPSDAEGTDEERLAAFCKTRDEIKDWLFKNLNRISEELDGEEKQ